jgi:hypothetical protein
MFEIVNALRHEERDNWVRQQRWGKLPFVLLQTFSIGGLIFILVTFSPWGIFNAPHFGKGMTVLIACMSLLIGYLLSKALWRKGLRITSTTDANE